MQAIGMQADGLEQYLLDNFPTLKDINNAVIQMALERSSGNQAMAAQMLGMSRQALNKRLKRKEELSS